MAKFNTGVSFTDGSTVTGADLNNITSQLNIYTGVISEQTAMVATVSTADQLLIADTDNGDSGAANRITVQKLLNDTLTNGTYTNAQLSGNLNVTQLSTLGTISSTRGTIGILNSTTGTITGLNTTTGTVATLNSTTGTITGLNSTNGTVATLNSTTGTITNLRSTTGTVATFNSTTGTITNLSTTLAGDFTISQGTGTLGTTAVTAGSYGSVSAIPFITVDTKGRVTAATTGTFSTIPADNSIAFVKFLSTDWTASLGSSGYQKLPSELIIQWGSGTAANNTSVSFPITFPTAAYCVIASCSNVGASRIVNAGSISTTGFVASGFVSNTASYSGGETFYYIALGK